jgi:hypothetical protein
LVAPRGPAELQEVVHRGGEGAAGEEQHEEEAGDEGEAGEHEQERVVAVLPVVARAVRQPAPELLDLVASSCLLILLLGVVQQKARPLVVHHVSLPVAPPMRIQVQDGASKARAGRRFLFSSECVVIGGAEQFGWRLLSVDGVC